MDESSCIYKEVSSWVWLKIWDFSTNTEKKWENPVFTRPRMHPAPGVIILSSGNIGFTMCFAHSGRVEAHPRRIASASYAVLPFSLFF
jgi:hypothetical protein